MVIACIVITILLLPLLFRNHLVVKDPLRQAEAIVVLGAPANEDGTIGQIARSRVDAGLDLYQDGFAPIMIVSGGAVRNEYSEADTMKEYALTQGIPAATLIVEDKSRNTFGNLKCIRDLLKERGWKSVILVTSAYHTRRVSLLNKRYFRLEAVLHPVRYPPEVKWHQVFYNIYAEYVLILRSKLIKHREFKEAE